MNIYVGNLSYNTTEDELRELFAQHGSVVSVNIIKDRETGNSKGFGFVEMGEQSEGETAINELNDSVLNERNLRVNQARPRSERR
ncbi:MAG: RNA-binding protein [Candidatus Mycalebacterium zealandia]|nr:MAG: RNA-binding protein [Candidatus Mycalebacterium zealandia]